MQKEESFCINVQDNNTDNSKVHVEKGNTSGGSIDELLLGSIDTVNKNGNEPFATLNVGNKDSPSKLKQLHSVIYHRNKFTTHHQRNQDCKRPKTHMAYGGMNIWLLDKCTLNIKMSGTEMSHGSFVIKAEKSKPLLALETCHKLQLKTVDKNVSKTQNWRQIS